MRLPHNPGPCVCDNGVTAVCVFGCLKKLPNRNSDIHLQTHGFLPPFMVSAATKALSLPRLSSLLAGALVLRSARSLPAIPEADSPCYPRG